MGRVHSSMLHFYFPTSLVYEPFIDDFERFTEDAEYLPRGIGTEALIPDPVCTFFWDGMLGDNRRMYYGRHTVLNDENYVLLIVGVRQNKFLPYLGYKLARNFTDVIIKFLQVL
jgi:hypothetical protein